MRWNDNSCLNCLNGISAKPFIRWNIILHGINSILVFLLLFWMTRKNLLASLVVAVIFSIHPMHVESVAWVSERKDVLYAFFFLTGLLTYIYYLITRKTRWIIITFGLFVLACLSKAVSVVFPLVMLLLYFWNDNAKNGFTSLKNTLKPSVIKHTIPFFMVSLIFGLIAVSVQQGGDFWGLFENNSKAVAINEFDTFTIIQRIQFASYGFTEYLIKFFVPINLCTYYPYPDQITFDNSSYFMLAPFLSIAIFIGIILSLKYTKTIAVGLGFYLITIVLVLQFVSVGAVIMADRYTYLPYIGFSFMLVMLVSELISVNLQKYIYVGLLLLALALIPLTIAQIETWQNTDTLWSNVIKTQSGSDQILHKNMDRPLSIRGLYFSKMAERTANVDDRKVWMNKAEKDFRLAIYLDTKIAGVYEGLGNLLGMQSRYAEALENYSKALKIDPTKGSVYINRGITYTLIKDRLKAVENFTKALELLPEKAPLIYVYRGIAYFDLGKRTEATFDFQKALEFNPNDQIAKEYLEKLKN